ncbi:MAG: Holliday junction resolvase RuvX [Desulfovibrionales bacterium]|nr:Holliday junction resolvase RuvX [Desulfovibrionales bacterium]
MTWLGIDYGQKRIGLALAHSTVAMPLRTLIKSTRERLFADFLAILDEYAISGIVLGLPVDMHGQETLTTRQVRNFHDSLARRTAVPLYLVNEALTSFEAQERLHAAGVPAHKHEAMLDQMAAVIILETFLENRAGDDISAC